MQQITLKAARVNAGLTQSEAAKAIGVSISTLKNWEKGSTYPKQPHIMKICSLYNLQYDNIFFDKKIS